MEKINRANCLYAKDLAENNCYVGEGVDTFQIGKYSMPSLLCLFHLNAATSALHKLETQMEKQQICVAKYNQLLTYLRKTTMKSLTDDL